MEIVEAIKARKSICAFLPQPVPRQVSADGVGFEPEMITGLHDTGLVQP